MPCCEVLPWSYMEGGCPEMFLKSVPESPSWLTYVLFLIICQGTPKPLDYPTFLGDLTLVLRDHKKVLGGGVSPLKMNLYSHFVTYLLETFAKTLAIGNSHRDVAVVSWLLVQCLCRFFGAWLTQLHIGKYGLPMGVPTSPFILLIFSPLHMFW